MKYFYRRNMNSYRLYILMFNALDYEYDLNKNQNLGSYLADLNPFLFEGENSADSYYYDDFKREFEKLNKDKLFDAEVAYKFCLDFIKKENVKEAVEAFEEFDKKRWTEVFNGILLNEST